jgi:hypothetical protein
VLRRLGVALATALVVAATPAYAEARVVAWFTEPSVSPGTIASLNVEGARHVTVQVFHVGGQAYPTTREGTLDGLPVSEPVMLPVRSGTVPVAIEYWPSGVYFVRVTGAGTWFAPFVLRAARLGVSRVAVVEPTNTWQAYNNFDGDSWYFGGDEKTSLDRPYLDRGVPRHFRFYDLGFLRWLARTNRHPDFLTDADLERIPGGQRLHRRYDLVVFPGHEEYVTRHAYDVITQFRDDGGKLAFLSANNFFYRVRSEGDTMTRRGRWRDLGRPEAALVGIQYVNWNEGKFGNAAFEVVGARTAPWFFAGTGLRNGSRFGTYGIEIDARTVDSPPGTRVLARIPDLFGPGVSAEMTYYETHGGAKVFAAGALNFGGTSLVPVVARMLENLWQRLTARSDESLSS